MGDVAALTWPLAAFGARLLNNPARRVRRSLFGPVDHNQAELILEEQMRNIAEENKLRWNFDFESERPLPPGRYLWEKVENPPDTDSGDKSESKDAEPEKADDKPEPPEAEDKPANHEQTHITDFMRKRKSSASKKDPAPVSPKTRRRSST